MISKLLRKRLDPDSKYKVGEMAIFTILMNISKSQKNTIPNSNPNFTVLTEKNNA
jgi:hypothetical protein